MPRPLINPVWIVSLSALYFILTLYFGYVFLFAEELYISEVSVEDQLVSSQDSWVKQVLSVGNSAPYHDTSSQVILSPLYSEYLFLRNHCNKTLTHSKPLFTKLVFIVIDAFRDDFVTSLSHNRYYSNQMLPYMEQIMKTHGLGLVSVASIPTVTLPRIKALLSGTLPSFMDYFMNLNAYKFKSDNIVEQLWKSNKSIVFYGDDTWGQIFADDMFHRINITSSLFATDYTEVDLNVTYNVHRDLNTLGDWDVMILHYLGVDHIGHLRGFHSDLYPDKLHEMDSVFRTIFDTLTYSGSNQEPYLIVITGDHGMTNSGNHGGDTRDETHTAMIFVSTNKSHVIPSGYNINGSPEKVLQIDFASTIASLFKFPFPSKNQGRVMSSVLERFEMPQEQHLCLLFQNTFQIQKLMKRNEFSSNDIKAYLVEALHHHYQFSNDRKHREFHFEQSKILYHKFIQEIQNEFLNRATDRSFFSSLTFVIILCFVIVLTLIWIEAYYNFSASVLFTHEFDSGFLSKLNVYVQSYWFVYGVNLESLKNKTFDPVLCFTFLPYFSSTVASMIALGMLFLSFVLIGSVSYLLNEHYFWYYVTLLILVIKLLVTVRGYLNFWKFKAPEIKQHYIQVFLSLLLIVLIFKLLSYWKMPVINDNDISMTDISAWLTRKEWKHYFTGLFLFSMIVMACLTVHKSTPFYLMLSSFFFTYLYRGLTGSVCLYHNVPVLQQFLVARKTPNLYAQIVYFHVASIVVFCIYHKLKKRLPARLRTGFFKYLMSLFEVLSEDSAGSEVNGKQCGRSGLLYALRVVWIISCTLLMEASVVPVFALNMMIETLLHFILTPPSFLKSLTKVIPNGPDSLFYKQIFYRMCVYLLFAYSSFYQIGNRNSLSTVSVTSCFIGLDAYMPLLCAIFMITSIYSTFVYWIIMFFIRLHEDFLYYNVGDLLPPTETSHSNGSTSVQQADNVPIVLSNLRNRIVHNYCAFYSIVNSLLIYQLAIMGMTMSVTLCLRDHLFIWSIICPKFVYQFCFTIIYFTIILIINALYTSDNLFLLN